MHGVFLAVKIGLFECTFQSSVSGSEMGRSMSKESMTG